MMLIQIHLQSCLSKSGFENNLLGWKVINNFTIIYLPLKLNQLLLCLGELGSSGL